MLIEVPASPARRDKVDVQHEHVTQMGGDGPALRFAHHHLCDPDEPEHIHGLPKWTSRARFRQSVIDGIRQPREMKTREDI